MFWYVYGTVIVICHVPITVDIIRLVRPEWKIPRVTGSVTQFVLVFLSVLVFCVSIIQHFTFFLPLLAPDPLHSLDGILHIVFSVWIWINVTVHFYMTLFVHPGEDKELMLSDNDNQNGLWNENTESGLTYRSRRGTQTGGDEASEMGLYSIETSDDPQLPKPQTGIEWSPKRTNYCRVCQINVAYADHHCPYIGRCLGFYNYAHFYIGMIYGLLGMLYAMFVTLPHFYRCDIKSLLVYFGLMDEEASSDVCEELGTQSRASVPVLVALWGCWNMVSIQTFFLLADISTFNVLKNIQRVPILRFTWHRIKGRKCLQPQSRLSVLLRKQRPNILYYILPLRNRSIRLREPISML